MFGLTPFDRKNDLFDPFRAFDDNFFGNFPAPVQSFRTDIRDEGDKYVMEAELPGFEKGDIKLDITGSTLVLSAEHSSESEEKDQKGSYIRRERVYGSCRRAFDISGIDSEKIEAEYKNGVLNLTLPKKVKTEPETKRLEIK